MLTPPQAIGGVGTCTPLELDSQALSATPVNLRFGPSSSISKTHGFSCCKALSNGPALKICCLCNSMQFGLHGLPIEATERGHHLHAKSLQRLTEFPDGFFFINALVTLKRSTLVFAASAAA